MSSDKKFNIKGLLSKIKLRKNGEDDTEQTVLGKVGSFFDPEPQKERVLNREDFKAAGDVYYASVSAFYKIFERLLWVILALFMAISLATNYKEITYDNFFYLLRDFSTAAEINTSNYQILSYDSDSRQNFALYRGGLVSASPSSISVFTAGGRRTLKSNNDYYSPNVISCDKYVLVYDTASSDFSVYNSFSKVYNATMDSPITDACFNSGGAFALSTRQNDTKTFIYLYDEDIKLRGRIPDNRFNFDIALNDSETRVAALYYSAGSGVGETALCIYDVTNSSSAGILAEVKLEGEFPLKCAFLDNDAVAVITNRSLRVYNKSFKEISYEPFGETEVSAFDASAQGGAVVLSRGSQKTVLAFDESGKTVYGGNVTENVSAVGVAGDFVFLRTVSGVIRIDMTNDESEYLNSDGGEMLVYGEDTAIVCGDAKAEYLVFGKN